jgi:hypothetical protein
MPGTRILSVPGGHHQKISKINKISMFNLFAHFIGFGTKRTQGAQPGVKDRLLKLAVEFALSDDLALIPQIRALYDLWKAQAESSERLKECLQFTAYLENASRQYPGLGRALVPFLVAESNLQIVSTAALNIAVLLPSSETTCFEGVDFVIRAVAQAPRKGAEQGAAIGGLMHLGDERFGDRLLEAWRSLAPLARNHAVSRHTPFVTLGQIRLLLACLTVEQDAGVFGSAAGTLANRAIECANSGALDWERRFPVWEHREEPILVRRVLSRDAVYNLIRGDLDRLTANETGPERVMPIVQDLWASRKR